MDLAKMLTTHTPAQKQCIDTYIATNHKVPAIKLTNLSPHNENSGKNRAK
jgi:hypothetical protein